MLQSTSQSLTCTKKWSWSLFGGLLPVWSATGFWIPVKSLHLRSMISKSKTARPAAGIVNRKGSFLLQDNALLQVAHPMLQKLNKLGCKVIPLPPYSLISCQLTTTSSSIFLQTKCFSTSRRQKCFPRVHRILKHGFLCYRNKQVYFLFAKMCWLYGSYFD